MTQSLSSCCLCLQINLDSDPDLSITARPPPSPAPPSVGGEGSSDSTAAIAGGVAGGVGGGLLLAAALVSVYVMRKKKRQQQREAELERGDKGVAGLAGAPKPGSPSVHASVHGPKDPSMGGAVLAPSQHGLALANASREGGPGSVGMLVQGGEDAPSGPGSMRRGATAVTWDPSIARQTTDSQGLPTPDVEKGNATGQGAACAPFFALVCCGHAWSLVLPDRLGCTCPLQMA